MIFYFLAYQSFLTSSSCFTENELGMSMSSSELSKQLILLEYQTKLVTRIISTSQDVANRYNAKLATLFGGVDEKAQFLADVMTLDTGEERKYRDLCRE